MIYILFHAKKNEPFTPCLDGLFAAAIAYNRHPQATLVPAMYGLENAPKISPTAGDTVYLLDLTYPRHVIESWHASGAKVVVLDHHKTAMQDLAGLSDSILSIFNMAQSGAMLAWDYFEDSDNPMSSLKRRKTKQSMPKSGTQIPWDAIDKKYPTAIRFGLSSMPEHSSNMPGFFRCDCCQNNIEFIVWGQSPEGKGIVIARDCYRCILAGSFQLCLPIDL